MAWPRLAKIAHPVRASITGLGQMASAITQLQNRAYAPTSNQLVSSSRSTSMAQTNDRGVSASIWPQALSPVTAVSPDNTPAMNWPINIGQNINYTPRPDADLSFEDLKNLGSYVLARICIENIKDIVSRCEWSFQLKPKPGEDPSSHEKRSKGDQNLTYLSKFFESPDGDLDWPDWLRQIMEDMLVIDAATVLIGRVGDPQTGKITRLDAGHGEMFARYVDDLGRTPHPPAYAYAQIYKGLPRTNLTTNQVLYKPRNIVARNTVSSYLYGMSPTEQSCDEIKAGAYRLKSVLAFYEKGSVPGILHIVPMGVGAKQIADQMRSINSQLAGQLEKRRQIQIMQGFRRPDEGTEQVMVLQDPVLADAFDEQHIRRICFAYGCSPQRMIKALNRAAGEQQQESSEEEGSYIWIDAAKSLVDRLIQRYMGFADYEAVPEPKQETDPQVEAQTTNLKVSSAQMTINEGRKKRGEEPDPNPIADKLGFLTASGFVPLDHMETMAEAGADAAVAGAKNAANPPELTIASMKHEADAKAQAEGNKGNLSGGKVDQKPKTEKAGATSASKGLRGRFAKISGESGIDLEWFTKRYNPNEPRDWHGRWTDSSSSSGPQSLSDRRSGRLASSAPGRLTRSERARLSHKPSTFSKQLIADHSEQHLSKTLGIPRTNDNSPFDLQNRHVGIEVKTITDNSNNKLTMHPESLARKREAAKALGIKAFTVVIDRRGEEPAYFYREGLGSFHLHLMTKASSIEELKSKLG